MENNLNLQDINSQAIIILLNKIIELIDGKEIENISIDNLDEIKAHIHNELRPVISIIKDSANRDDIIKSLNSIKEELKKKDFSPEITVSPAQVNIPEVRFPDYPTELNLSQDSLRRIHNFFMGLGDVVKKSVKITVPEPRVTVNIPEQQPPVIHSTTVNLERLESILEPLIELERQIVVNVPDLEIILKEIRDSLEKNARQVMAFSGGPDKVKLLDSAGNIINPVTSVSVGSVNATTLGVTTGSQSVLSANNSRTYAFIQNDSDTTIYLRLGSTAVANTGIRLNANGSFYEINQSNMYKGAISAIHGGTGTKTLLINEGT